MTGGAAGPIYGLPEFLIWFRYDNTGKRDWAVIEAADADSAIGRLRGHACPLPITPVSVEPWTDWDPLPGEVWVDRPGRVRRTS